MAALTETPSITLIYRLYFTTIEPLLALTGSYLAIFRPRQFLDLTAPASLLPSSTNSSDDGGAVSPLIRLLLMDISILYIFFALNLAILLRVCSDMRVWRTLLSTALFSDVGHLGRAWWAMELGFEGGGMKFWDMRQWGSGEWGSLGTLWLGLGMRVAFLTGVGLRERGKANGEVSERRAKGDGNKKRDSE
ncbi:MAG: hypothetical protein M1827_006929 [Pycnora praestabilis]|nr:MAG: hypothetical protein M1827_006929 [Pycnora praestabilis]